MRTTSMSQVRLWHIYSSVPLPSVRLLEMKCSLLRRGQAFSWEHIIVCEQVAPSWDFLLASGRQH